MAKFLLIFLLLIFLITARTSQVPSLCQLCTYRQGYKAQHSAERYADERSLASYFIHFPSKI